MFSVSDIFSKILSSIRAVFGIGSSGSESVIRSRGLMLSFRRHAHRNASLTLFPCFLSSLSFADSSVTTQRTITKLAEGVYEIRHPDAPDTFPQGNTTVIIGERSVLVVDSCLLPSSAREDVD